MSVRKTTAKARRDKQTKLRAESAKSFKDRFSIDNNRIANGLYDGEHCLLLSCRPTAATRSYR